jgi:hypothetical protein
VKARLYIDVKFGRRATDAESMAAALDNVIDVGMSALHDCWDDYGGKPSIGKFLVLATAQAAEHAQALDMLIDGEDDELGEMLKPVRDFLRQVAGPEH